MPQNKPLIYVFDDNRLMTDLICLHLHQAGYEARGYEDAVEGGKALLSERPDLLVLDILMPYLDGLELLKAMRSDVKTAGIPTIVLTSRTDARAEQEAAEAGAVGFLVKPLQRKLLLETVAAVLGRRPAEAPPAG